MKKLKKASIRVPGKRLKGILNTPSVTPKSLNTNKISTRFNAIAIDVKVIAKNFHKPAFCGWERNLTMPSTQIL